MRRTACRTGRNPYGVSRSVGIRPRIRRAGSSTSRPRAPARDEPWPSRAARTRFRAHPDRETTGRTPRRRSCRRHHPSRRRRPSPHRAHRKRSGATCLATSRSHAPTNPGHANAAPVSPVFFVPLLVTPFTTRPSHGERSLTNHGSQAQ